MNHRIHLCLSVVALAMTAHAQTASYTLFGEGCNGAPVTNCLALNDVNPVHQLASLPNEYAYPFINTTGIDIQVLGFEIFTTTNTAIPETGNTGLLFDASGPTATAHTSPSFTNAANGKITVSPTTGWYATSIYPPITIPAGVAFWLHVDAYSRISPPQHSTVGGVTGPVANWWRRPNYINFAWSVSGSVARQIIRIHCLPALPTVPALTATGLPQFGTTLTMHISGGGAFAPGFVIWALDRTQWQSFPTPYDLALFGAPGCFVQTSTDATALVLLDGMGMGMATMGIPTDPSFGGFTFYNQAAVLSPGSNQLGVLIANAATAVVGN